MPIHLRFSNRFSSLGNGNRFPLQYSPKGGSLLTVIHRLGLIAFISILVGAVLPGAVAHHEGIFYKSSTESLVKSRHPEVASAMLQFEAEQARSKALLTALESKVLAPGAVSDSSLPALATLRQAYQVDQRKKLPVSIQPFYLQVIMYFWPVMYCGLATAIFIVRPSETEFSIKQLMRSSVFWLALCIFAFFAVPLLFRTLTSANFASGRTVYAWSNPDLSIASFVVQLFNFTLLSLLLAIIWTEWSDFASEQRSKLLQANYAGSAVSFELINNLSSQLLRWQAAFLSISIGFAIYTEVFWTQIVRNGDSRFWFEAIIAHAMWLVTITITAVPLIVTWRAWRRQKLRAITDLLNQQHPLPDGFEAKIAAIRDLGAVSNWNVVLSGATILVTLAVPCIQAFIK